MGIWSGVGVTLGGLGNDICCGCDTLIQLSLSAGRIVMDEDLERIAFVANLGMIPPLESVSIFISTSSELQTLPSGAVRVLLPAVCVPRVPQPSLENTSSLSSHLLRMYGTTGWLLIETGAGRQHSGIHWGSPHLQGQAVLLIGEPRAWEQFLSGPAAAE